MNKRLQDRAVAMRADGSSIKAIADELGLWPTSVVWMLKRGEMLERERLRRREEGRDEIACSICGEKGHNMTSCGVERP